MENILNDEFLKSWPIYYLLACNYYDIHGNLEIPFLFKTSDGINYDENGYALGKWVSLNYKCYKYLPLDMQKKLYNIKFASGAVEVKWLHNFKLAKKYYDYHGNLRLMRDFKTKNGINYDENGETLGIWVVRQRRKYKNHKNQNKTFLEIEHELLLESIGMIWDIYENVGMIKDICTHYCIDYLENYDELSSMQYQELNARINCLREKNIKLINDDGSLNNMLLISKKDFNYNFNINLSDKIKEELINSKEKETMNTKK